MVKDPPTNTQTHRQDRLQYTAPQLERSVKIGLPHKTRNTTSCVACSWAVTKCSCLMQVVNLEVTTHIADASHRIQSKYQV